MVSGRIELDCSQLKKLDAWRSARQPPAAETAACTILSKTIKTPPWNEIATILPVEEFESALVQSLMQTLNSRALAHEIGGSCGYDASQMGHMIILFTIDNIFFSAPGIA
jgi:hypothetical protein